MLWEWRPKCIVTTFKNFGVISWRLFSCNMSMTSAALFIDILTWLVFSWMDWTGVGLPELAPCQNYSDQQLGQSYHWQGNHSEWRHLTYKEHLGHTQGTDSQFWPGPCPEKWKRCWLYSNPLVLMADQQHAILIFSFKGKMVDIAWHRWKLKQVHWKPGILPYNMLKCSNCQHRTKLTTENYTDE